MCPLISSPSVEQRHMYRIQKSMNFRGLYKLLAKKSRYILTNAELASIELHHEISQIGQYAELGYGSLSIEYVLGNLDTLLQTDYPLEGYDALISSVCVADFTGKVAGTRGFVAYRTATKQLILSITGTRTALQAIYDLRFIKHRCRNGDRVEYRVHTGFWRLYEGIRSLAIDGIEKGLQEHQVSELVITGHSMGGVIAYLLTIDLLRSNNILTPALAIKLVVFGTPRIGGDDFVIFWNKLLDDFRSKHGPNSMKEYSIKNYNDGVPLLPPFEFDYRHCTKHPLYLLNGHLFHIPESEKEFALFDVVLSSEKMTIPPMYPRGGHNYYSERDMVKLVRRMEWFEKGMHSKKDRWQDLYQAKVARRERAP